MTYPLKFYDETIQVEPIRSHYMDNDTLALMLYTTDGEPFATLTVNIDGERRIVNMREEDGRWKVNLNVALNPKRIVLPDDIPPDYIENFAVTDEHEAWWEEAEEKSDDDKGGKKGMLDGLKGKFFKK